MFEVDFSILDAVFERAEKASEEADKQQDAIKELADLKRLAELTKCKVNIDVKNNNITIDTLLDCIKCISILTQDVLFFEQNYTAIKQKKF